MQQIFTNVRRNIMDGGNVIVCLADGAQVETIGVESYASVSNALRAVRSGSAVRRSLHKNAPDLLPLVLCTVDACSTPRVPGSDMCGKHLTMHYPTPRS